MLRKRLMNHYAGRLIAHCDSYTCFYNSRFSRIIVIFSHSVPVAYRVSGRHLFRRPNAEHILAKRSIWLMGEFVVFGQRFCPGQRVATQLTKKK